MPTPPFLPSALAVAAVTISAPVMALDSFVVESVRVDGLQRLESSTVLTYLPLSVGDTVTQANSRQAIRSLYDTGLFQDVSLSREGGVLVVTVKERPLITSFEIEGNKKIGGDELLESLKEAGLAEGELFKRALLDSVEQEMQRQYYSNGYYGVRIESEVIEEPQNRVAIKIDVKEGEVAKISQINIVGNTVFTDEELLDSFELEPSKAYKFFQKTDRYSKQKLLGDLEGLGSYYQDRGYLRFSVDSVQVALSPDKKDIFVTINVVEGDVYTVKKTELTGELVLEEEQLRRLILVREGQTFSRRAAETSGNNISGILSNLGYAFAEVEPVPIIDDENREVTLRFEVDPGKRVYVRRINFSGHYKTNDETLRREMRQLEGAPYSKTAIERSRTRLARLPFLAEVEVDTEKVAGSEDLVDINYTVTERPPGSIQLGVGFSDAQGFIISGGITHTNFRGTGQRLSLEGQNNEFSTALSMSWTEPYATQDGISRTIAAFFRESDQIVRFSSGFDLSTLGASLTYGIPISEFTSIRIGAGFEQNAITAFAGNTATEILQFTVDNGTRIDTYELRTGIGRDTRNRTIFATAGSLSRFNLDVAVPGSDLEFYRSTFQHIHYWPLPKNFIVEFNGRISLADGYSGSDDIPPYERFFAGGAQSVRGFEDGTLGPRDTPFGNPFGGKVATTAQTELIIPTPLESNNRSTRFSLFYDIGNVFEDSGDIEFSELRSSGGVAFYWLTPLFGVLKLSYAVPIKEERGDEIDRFQISFGVGL